MPQSVYIFNGTPNVIGLNLNSYPLVGSIDGISFSTNYTPNQFVAARNASPGNPGLAQFGGDNTLVVFFPGGGGMPQQYQVKISGIPLNKDLQLYVFYNEIVLVTPTGEASQPSESILLKGTAPDEEQLKLLS